jgi:type I restriction enzyme, S subunit
MEDELASLPEGWSQARLARVVEVLDHRRVPVNNTDRQRRLQASSTRYPYYGATGQVGEIDDFIFEGEAVLLGEDGAPFFDLRKSKAYLVSGKYWVNNHAHILRGSGAINNGFLCYQLNQVDYRPYVAGTTRLKLTKGSMNEIKVLVPPLPEQRRIVEKIETLFTRLDKGEEAVRQVQALLKRYRQSVLKAAVTGDLTADWRSAHSAAKWKEAEIGDLTDFLTSGSRGWAKYYATHGALFIRAQNLKHDRLDLEDVAFVKLPKKSEGTRTLVQQGDLLVTITGANVTKTALVTDEVEEAYVSQHVGLLRLTEHADAEFIYWFLVADAGGRKQLEKFAYGAGKPGLNLTNIREVKLALPSLSEQIEIVKRVREEMDRINMVETWCKTELVRSTALRQSILKQAFSGRLVPQDPSDEPASDLLARIHAAGKTKNTRKAG